MNAITPQDQLAEAAKKLLALVLAPELFDREARARIIREARSALGIASAERN